MKDTKLAVLLSVLLAASLSFAGENDVDVGNGEDGATLAYHEEALEKAGMDFSLEFMKLTTPRKIKDRTKKLNKLFSKMEKVNIGKVASAIQNEFGINVLKLVSDMNGGWYCPDELSTKGERMLAVVVHYSKGGCQFNDADPAEVPYKKTVKISKRKFNLSKLSGGRSWGATSSNNISTLFETRMAEDHTWHYGPFDILSRFDWEFTTTSKASYAGHLMKPFSAPVVVRFLEVMQESQLKGLDTTLVFTAGEITITSDNQEYSPTVHVVYPTYSRLAAIPQPVMYVTPNASKRDIRKALAEHAPRIYAYNKVFDEELMPSLTELYEALDDYPEITEELRKIKGDVSRHNVAQALKAAFLNVTYTSLATVGSVAAVPVRLADMLLSPIFNPILVSTVIVVY